MNKVTRNIAALIAFGLGTASIGFAQVTQQKIGNNPTLINPNAALEVESANKGILLPRLGLTATNSFAPLAAHVAGMTVYNTATAGTAPNNVTPGYYYNDGTQWVRVATGADAKTEPWREQATTNEATANSQNIYQTGSVAVGDFSTAASTKKMEVKGDFKAEVTAAGGVAYGTEISHPVNPNGAMHYWLTSPTNYRIASANAQGAILQGVSGTTTNTVAASDIKSEMSSLNGSNSLSAVRAENTGNFFMESYNVSGNFGSTLSLQNDGLRLRHTNTNGAADPFPLNNSSEIFVQKANGVRFNFRDAAAVQTGEYWFPTTTGTAGQVMTQTATGKMVWASPSGLLTEVDGVIGNEVTNATTNGGLTRAGTGTTASPYTLGLTPGSATGNVMTWNGTAWNPAAPVNIYNADGTVTSNRVATLNDKELTFLGEFQSTTLSRYAGLIQEGLASSPYNQGSMKIIAPDKNGNGSKGSLSMQAFSEGEAQIFANEDVTLLSISTHATPAPAPITFGTSAGGGALGTEKMRITGTGNVGIATISPSEKFDIGAGNIRVRDINGLAGNTTTDKVVVADGTGVLKTVTVASLASSPVNIYNANGTLTGARTVTTANNNLTFAGTGSSVLIATNATEGRVTATGTTRGSITVTGGNSIVDVYADNNLKGQISARGTGTTGLDIRTEGTTPLSFLTNNAQRMRITPTGEVAIGATTAPSFVVGGSTIQPLLHVAGDISTTGKLWTTNSVYADYVFEDYFNGFSKIYKDYKFKSLKEVAQFIKTNKHLPGVTPISEITVGENGYTIDLTQLSMQQLEKLEELYLHVIEMNDTLSQKDIEIDALQHKTNELEERLKKLESLLIKQ